MYVCTVIGNLNSWWYYRAYTLRRIKDAFRENKNVTDPKVINQLLSKAKHNLEIIKRQVKWQSIVQDIL